LGDGLQREEAAADGPLVVLFGEQGSAQEADGSAVGEAADDAPSGRRVFLLSRSCGLSE